MEISECCAAPIIYGDICSDCKEHTGIIYLCEQCEEEIEEYKQVKDYCLKCEREMIANGGLKKELDQNADSE